MSMGRLLKVREAALILNVDRRTIWKWIKEGKIKAVRLPSGRYRIPESEVIRIITGAETLADLSENY